MSTDLCEGRGTAVCVITYCRPICVFGQIDMYGRSYAGAGKFGRVPYVPLQGCGEGER